MYLKYSKLHISLNLINYLVSAINPNTFTSPNNKENGQATDRRPVSLSRCAEGTSCETEVFPERTFVMKTRMTEEQGWHRNTEFSCEVKTVLLSDRKMKPGKEYIGMLKLDFEGMEDDYHYRDSHYTFVETIHPTAGKRNPHVFRGKYITITCRDDGSLRPNFKPMKMGAGFSIDSYAIGVCNELRQALHGLVEE